MVIIKFVFGLNFVSFDKFFLKTKKVEEEEEKVEFFEGLSGHGSFDYYSNQKNYKIKIN